MTARPATVFVTGACGNLGRKVIEAFAQTAWCHHIIGVDLQDDASGFSPAARSRLALTRGDLTRPEPAWRDALATADAVVHLAARNPQPHASWAESMASFDMTANLLLAAAQAGLHRFVFASSNHVMGGYKDPPLADGLGPGRLTTALPPAPGTRWHDGTGMIDSTAYSLSKAMGERLCQAAAGASSDGLTTVCVRVGWTQPGENHPAGISHSGSHVAGRAQFVSNEADRRALRWYRNMWLSNADLGALFAAAVTADATAWPARGIIVNGTSRNRDTDWDLAPGQVLIGYAPQDDIYDHVPEV
jgi:nucleoside-diphosphate-sugar epimerase